MKTDQALSLLEDAKKNRLDWRKVAEVLDAVSMSDAWREHFDSVGAWHKAASEVSGYSESMLRRTHAVHRFLEDKKDEFEDYAALDTGDRPPSFGTLEVLKRIYQMDKEKGRTLFPKIAKRDISHRAVVEIYSEMTGPSPFVSSAGDALPAGASAKQAASRILARRAPKDFSDAVSTLVQEQVAELCRDAEARYYFRHFNFDYCAPDAVALKLNGMVIEWVDGFEFHHFSGALKPERRNQLVAEAALAATFFRHYWLVVGKAGELAATLAKDLEKLSLQSVGLIEVNMANNAQLRLLRTPEALPVPERLMAGQSRVLRDGIPDLVHF